VTLVVVWLLTARSKCQKLPQTKTIQQNASKPGKKNEMVTATGSFNVLAKGENLEKWQQQIKRIKMELLWRGKRRKVERGDAGKIGFGSRPGAEIKIKTSSKCN